VYTGKWDIIQCEEKLTFDRNLAMEARSGVPISKATALCPSLRLQL